jgi:hypothetical protein
MNARPPEIGAGEGLEDLLVDAVLQGAQDLQEHRLLLGLFEDELIAL